MNAIRLKNTTRVIGLDQRFKPLPVIDMVWGDQPIMMSCWQPTPKEIAEISEGKPICVYLGGRVHPPIMVETGETLNATF